MPTGTYAIIRPRLTMVSAWVAVTGATIMIVWLILHPPVGATFWYMFQGVLAVWLITWLIWLCGAKPRLVVSDAGVDVINFFVRYQIPWRAISWIQSTDEIVIHLIGGNRVKPAVGGWSLVGRWRGNAKQRDIRERIEQMRKTAREGPATAVEVRRQLDVHPIPFLAMLSVLEVLTWLLT